MKPYMTLQTMLVHPKEKCTPQGDSCIVYQAPCKDCQYIYTGKMERIYGLREKEHKRDVKTLEEKKYTRSSKKELLLEVDRSAIMDHVVKNHTIDWEGVKLPTRDVDWTARGVKVVLEIGKIGAHTRNRDRGCHQLPSLYSKLLVKKTSSFVTNRIVHEH